LGNLEIWQFATESLLILNYQITRLLN
jgi:hypothetical protein